MQDTTPTSPRGRRLSLLAGAAAALALAACGAAPTSVPLADPPTEIPAVLPTAEPTAAPSCPDPTEGTNLLRRDDLGYCLLYPTGLASIDTPPDQECLVSEGPSMLCHTAVAFINVTDAGGRSAGELADEKMVREGGSGPERDSLTIAGVEAVVLPQVAGQDLTRQVWFVHDDRLYVLSFVLPDPEDASAVERFERLFETVSSSFTLLPIAPSSSTTRPGQATAGSAMVAFVGHGNVLVWQEASGWTLPLFDGGDAIDLALSDDGHVVAFLSRALVQLSGDPNINWREQSELWATDRGRGIRWSWSRPSSWEAC
jgi:hypothetical protein